MAYQGIGTGTTPNDNTGDSLFTGAVKINSNFTEIYNALGDGSSINLSKSRTITAGNGLTGGGDLSADRTLNVGQGDGITVSADTVAVDSTVIRTSGGQTISGALTVTGNVTGGGFNFILGNSDQSTRGNSGASRALVKDSSATLVLNYGGDFTGGVRIDSPVRITGGITAPILYDSSNPGYYLWPASTSVLNSINLTGTLNLNTGPATVGDALVIQNSGDLRLYSAGNAGSVRVYCDTNSILNVDGNITTGVFNSTTSTGTAPFTVASSTKVTNLNVDLLDGIDSSRIVYGDDATKTSINNDWDSALSSGFYNQLGPSGTGTPTESWYHMISCRHPSTGNNYQMQISGHLFDVNDFYYRIINNGSPTSWYKIWHSGNDGSGSGLDADLLDGLQSASTNTPSTIVARDGSGGFDCQTQSASDNSTKAATTAYIKSLLGSATASGTLNWNDVSNTRPGASGTLLLGNAANGPSPANYFHPFNLEYASKDGTGNVTQLAISYGSPGNDLWMRGRYDGTWSSWVRYLNNGNIGSYAVSSLATSGTGISVNTSIGSVTITSNATSTNTPSTIVARDGSGNFSAGTVTATAVTVNGPISASSFGGNLNTPFQPNISVSDKTTTNFEILSGVYYVRDFIVPTGFTCYLNGVVYIMAQRDVIIGGTIFGQGSNVGTSTPNDSVYGSGGLIVGNSIGIPGSGVAGGRMPWGGKRISAITSLMGSAGASGNASGGSVSGTYTISAGGLPGQSFIVRASGSITVTASGVINLDGQSGSSQSSTGYNLSGGGGGSGGVLILDANQNCTNSGQISAIGGSGASGYANSYGGGGGGGGIVIIQSRLGTASIGTVDVSGGSPGFSPGTTLGSPGGGGCGGKGGDGGYGATTPTSGSAGVVSTYGTPW